MSAPATESRREIRPETDARRRFVGHAALVVVQVCFGLFPVFGVLAFRPGGVEPASVAAWRMLFGAAVLGAAAALMHGRAMLVGPRDMGLLLVGSLLGVTLNMVLFLEGLARSTPTNASLMMGLIPVATFVLAAAVGQERFSALRMLGVLVALVGASSRFWAERPELAHEHAFGNLLMAGNALCYSGFLVVTRPLLVRHPPMVVIGWNFLLSAPFVPFLARGVDLVPPAATTEHWWAMGLILVVSTLVAYVLNTVALARVRASTAATYIYLQPLITATASAFVLGEELTPSMLLAAVLVFGGIALVMHRPRASVASAST